MQLGIHLSIQFKSNTSVDVRVFSRVGQEFKLLRHARRECFAPNCNIFSVLSIFECNPGKTNDKFIISMISSLLLYIIYYYKFIISITSLLLFNHFYPAMSYRRIQKKEKATNYFCTRVFGHSLWSANQLPAQRGLSVHAFSVPKRHSQTFLLG